MRRSVLIATAILAVALPSAAQAQNPVELGVDGVVAYTLTSPHVSTVAIPVQRLRVGFFISPRVSIEPFGALTHFSENGNSNTNVTLGVGGLYQFGGGRGAPQPYVRPFAELAHRSFADKSLSGGASEAALGAGVGLMIPASTQFAWRFEGTLTQVLEHDSLNGGTMLSGFFGLSFFIH